MTENPSALAAIDPELLVASFTPSGEVGEANPAWRSLLGEQEDPWEKLSVDDKRLARQSLSEAAAGSLVTNQIIMIQAADRDEPLPILFNFLPVHMPSRRKEAKVRAVAVTGEVLAEPTTWTESQTLRHRMETLGRMTMGIAHDFNNLLSGILGYSELIQSQLSERSSAAPLMANMRTIEQAALDGAALVRKIQQYIRQETETRFEPVDIDALIEECIAFTRPYWYNEPRRKAIAIDAEKDLASGAAVHGAPPELREVFINLILNAVQAMPEGGKLRFSTSFDADKGVLIKISDTGVGMPDHIRERIFEPLFTTKGKHGTGMGLSVSYGIIQEHEGSISVESQPGYGTTFKIILPPAEQPVAKEVATPQAPAQKSARVLVVDDEHMVRSVLSKLLAMKGHEVQLAASGAEALVLTESEEFDVVFTDHGMPEMNGRQLARALRRRLPDLPIVLVTGDTEAGEADENIDLVVAKPFKIEQLNEVIRKLVT